MSNASADPQQLATAADAAARTSLAHAGRGQRFEAWARKAFCRVMLLPLYTVCTSIMRYKSGYRIADLAEIRRRYRAIAAEPGPILVCGNHLTFIDSALLIWAFGSCGFYFTNYSRFSWNLPAGDFFKKKLLYRFVALVSKCIFIHRDGSKQHKDGVLQLCHHLLQSGEVVTIFPEGRRSRTGRFDPQALTHGVGKLVSELGGCRVLCVYLRGDKQDTYSNYPAPGSTFHLDMKLLDLRPRSHGREAYHEIVAQIGQTIHGMEQAHFARLGR